MAFEPTSTPRMTKIVAGFHSFDLDALSLTRSAASKGSVGRRNGFGTNEVQKDVVATRGRLLSSAFCQRGIVEYGRRST